MKFWKLMLPAMIERARHWEYQDDYIYKEGTPRTDTVEGRSIIVSRESFCCYCGFGKIYRMLINAKIGDIGAVLTHAAISPIFAAPFVEPVTHSWREDGEANRATSSEVEEVVRCVESRGPKDVANAWL
jgi:hypothetical protein